MDKWEVVSRIVTITAAILANVAAALGSFDVATYAMSIAIFVGQK